MQSLCISAGMTHGSMDGRGRAWPTRNVPSAGAFPLEIVAAREEGMNGLIYLIGLIVVILFILSFLGLR